MELTSEQCTLLAQTVPAVLLAFVLERKWLRASSGGESVLRLILFALGAAIAALTFTLALIGVNGGLDAAAGKGVLGALAFLVLLLVLQAVTEFLDRDDHASSPASDGSDSR